MQTADFEQALAVHFWAPLQTMLSAIPVMRGQGGGRIVNISSIGGKIGVAHLIAQFKGRHGEEFTCGEEGAGRSRRLDRVPGTDAGGVHGRRRQPTRAALRDRPHPV
jgi:NAD(P)-dependent dehydrogenase (short-subunit alcohol dehydrogenase family)